MWECRALVNVSLVVTFVFSHPVLLLSLKLHWSLSLAESFCLVSVPARPASLPPLLSPIITYHWSDGGLAWCRQAVLALATFLVPHQPQHSFIYLFFGGQQTKAKPRASSNSHARCVCGCVNGDRLSEGDPDHLCENRILSQRGKTSGEHVLLWKECLYLCEAGIQEGNIEQHRHRAGLPSP